MDGSFFAFALIGALAGYILGDFQRELRYRREARANLRLAVDRLPVSDSNGDDDRSGPGSKHLGPGHYLDSARREARRRAIRGDHDGPRTGPASAGRRSRGADASPLALAGRRWEFDGD